MMAQILAYLIFLLYFLVYKKQIDPHLSYLSMLFGLGLNLNIFLLMNVAKKITQGSKSFVFELIASKILLFATFGILFSFSGEFIFGASFIYVVQILIITFVNSKKKIK